MNSRQHTKGFTLIELSIVLVIIGLIVGGVVVGRDLIKAAEIRSAISHFEKFDTAAMTFKLKYNCLPGDCSAAAQFGFQARETASGAGNNNKQISSLFTSDNGGMIDAVDISKYFTFVNKGGDESQLFWSDLSASGLISENISAGDPSTLATEQITPFVLKDAFIIAGCCDLVSSTSGPFGYTLLGFPKGTGNLQYEDFGNGLHFAPLNTIEAFMIDSKMDDGDPLGGKVYTLNVRPALLTSPNKGALTNCSTDSGGGVGTYSLANSTDNVCVIKVRGSI